MLEALAEVHSLQAAVAAVAARPIPARMPAPSPACVRGANCFHAERIAYLLDAGSAFLELSPLAGWGRRTRWERDFRPGSARSAVPSA